MQKLTETNECQKGQEKQLVMIALNFPSNYQAVKPGFEFWLLFFFFFSLVQSQIALWSLTRMRHLCMRTAHGICRSCRREKLARIPSFLGR